MSSRELTEWAAYWELEPFGPAVESWRTAVVAALLANANRGKGAKAAKVEDFMPRMERRDGGEASLNAFRALAKRGRRG